MHDFVGNTLRHVNIRHFKHKIIHCNFDKLNIKKQLIYLNHFTKLAYYKHMLISSNLQRINSTIQP